MDRPCKTYLCEYYHDGSWWGLEITAYDWPDAEARAKKLSLQLRGELHAKIPAVPGAKVYMRLVAGVKRLAARGGK